MIHPNLYDSLTPSAAVAIQNELRALMNIQPFEGVINFIGGADVSFNKFEDTVYAGVVVLKFPQLTVVESATVITQTRFPYISGLLAFREVPALLLAWKKLKMQPDVLVLDGQGIAHPRRLGIATHFGIITNTPTIGCGKSKLTGSYEMPENKAFAATALSHKGEIIGTVLRSKTNCNPLFISPGYKTSITQSVAIVKKCITKYRVPETTRFAHKLVNEARIANKNVLE